MVRHVQTEHLLFEGQAGRLVELDVGDLSPLIKRWSGFICAEQGHDPHVMFPAARKGVVDDLLVGMEQSLARVAEAVK